MNDNFTLEYTACPDCDLLVAKPDSASDYHRQCPRCNAMLWESQRGPQSLSLAAAISGLILFIPAIGLPIMELNMVGQYGSNSLLGGVARLLSEGESALAALVLLCSVIAPFFQLLIIAWVGLCQRHEHFPYYYPTLIRTGQWMSEWSMLEVYALGALVAYIKMMDPGEISLANGAWCLAGLLVCILLSAQHFHLENAWRHWARRPS